MAKTILKELQDSKDLQFVIDETKARFSSIFWPSLLTVTSTDTLRWDTVIGERKSGIAGNVTAFDVSKPLHGRDALREKGGKIPSIRGKRKMKETDFLRYIALSRQNNPNKQRVLDLVFNDIEFCSTAPHKRVDWIITKLLSSVGKVAFTAADNVGVVTQYDIDFEVPAENKKGTVGGIWTNPETSTPLTDLKKNFFEPMADKGWSGGVIRMHPSKVFEFIASKEVKTTLGIWSNQRANQANIEIATVNQWLAANNYPQIRPFNASVGIEIDGKPKYENPWVKQNVVWTPDGPVGQLHEAPIVDLLVDDPDLTVSTYLGAAVTRWYEKDPKVEYTGYEFNAFPSLDIADNMLAMNTEHEGTFE